MFGSRIAYTACMLIATIVAGWLLRRRQQTLPIEGIQKWGIVIGGLVGATFAAKIPFILGADPTSGLVGAWLSDGKTILWGLAGGYLGVELAKWALLVRTSTGDSFVIPVAVAIAIGRIGCLLFGCCYGIETDQNWGIAFVTAPDGGAMLRHPTQIYEIVFHLSFALITWTAIRADATRCETFRTDASQRHASSRWRGNWMPTYLVSYAAYRFVSEYWRPELDWAGGLTFYQWSSIVIGTAFALLLTLRWHRCALPVA
ncbi:MAG: diacylglyceryl transferase [Pirellulaceae bacterium]|nr:diacylglyceryl transferase [Pirellulaceae bacterium]